MISFILPTLGQRENELRRLFDSFESQTSSDFEVIIVSQDNHDSVSNIIKEYSFTNVHVESSKKGISVSRNIGMEYVNGSIVAFADDDCWYKENAVEYVHNYMSKNKSQIVTFQHIDKDLNQFPKKYPQKSIDKLSKRMVLKQASIDIFVNAESVPCYGIPFDERFGLGAKYNSGEENIYLMDLRGRGYSISYEPHVVSYHPNKVKKGDKLNGDMLIGKGPLFKRLFGDKMGTCMYAAFMAKKMFKAKGVLKVYSSGIREMNNFTV